MKKNHFIILIILYFSFSPKYYAQSIQPDLSKINVNQKWMLVNKDKRISFQSADTKPEGRKTGDLQNSTLPNFEKYKFLRNEKNVLFSKTLLSGWEKMDQPNGGSIRRFYEFNNTLYAISDREIFVYDHNEWKGLNFGNHLCNIIHCMYRYNSGRIIVGTDFDFYYTDDNGVSWNSIFLGTGYPAVWDIYKTKNGDLLLSTTNGIYISGTDPQVFSLLTLKDTYVCTVNIDNLGNIWAGTNSGVYKAKYADLVWEKTGLDDDFYERFVIDSNNVIYTFSNYYVYMTKDLGKSWYSMSGNIICDITKDKDENLIFANGYNIVFADTNGAQFISRDCANFLYSVYTSKDNELLAGTSGAGAMHYDRLKDVFSDFGNEGLNVSTIRALVQMGNGELFACTDADSFYISKDDGLSWKSISKSWTICIKVRTDGSIYACIGNCLSKSNDFGRSWQKLNLDVTPYYINAFDISKDNKIICAGSSTGEVYLSDNAGVSFKLIRKSDYNFVDAVKILNNNTLLIQCGSLYYSNFSGDTLNIIWDNTIREVNDFADDRFGNIYLANYDGIFRSTDGIKWSPLLNQQEIKYLRADQYDNLYAITVFGSVFASNDQGKSWTQITDQIPYTFSWSFAVTKNGYILNGTQDRGLYRKKIEIKKRGVPSFSLSQNYPNPFNPSTTIEYVILNQGLVTLKIYDILGNQVTTLVNEYETGGNYSINFNAAKLASGVYIYILISNGNISSQKMVLLK